MSVSSQKGRKRRADAPRSTKRTASTRSASSAAPSHGVQESRTVALPVLNETSCAERLKALADETRLSVVRQLMAGPKRVSEINAELQVEQTLLSHHLKVLREMGLVVAEREGKSMLYRLAPNVGSAKLRSGIDLGCCVLSFD